MADLLRGIILPNFANDAYLSQAQTTDVTVQVPEDYATINEATEYLTKTYNPTHGFTAEISLADGYTIAEQLLFDGQDLSWIKYTSRSATGAGDYPTGKHLVDRTALTVDFGIDYGVTSYPVFCSKNGASSPVLDFVLDGQVALGSGMPPDNKMGIVSFGGKVNCTGTAGAVQMSSAACYVQAGIISAYTMTNSSDSSFACYVQAGTISALTMTNSSDSSAACYVQAGIISAYTMTNSSDSGRACYVQAGIISAYTMTNSSDSSRACYVQAGIISAYTMTNSSDSSFACYTLSGAISANIMTNSSDSSFACYAIAGIISAHTMALSNGVGSTVELARVLGGGAIKSYTGTWTDNGTGGKANQAAVTVTANGYINRIG